MVRRPEILKRLDQQEGVDIILENCVFRKPFQMHISGLQKCVVNIKKCLGVEKGFFSIFTQSDAKNIHVVTDEYSLNMFHNFQYEYCVK